MGIVKLYWTFGINGFLVSLAILFFAAAPRLRSAETPSFTFVMIEYSGGSWKDVRAEQEAHVKDFIPKFMRWLNLKKIVTANEKTEVLRLTDSRIFDYPMLYINGHFTFQISDPEKQNLKTHLERGGFLYIEDCGGDTQSLQKFGSFAKCIHDVVQSIFPEGRFQVLPFNHDIYRFPYEFPNGLPNMYGDNNDSSPESPSKRRKGQGGEGFFHRGRMISFYSDADTCCGWDWNGVGQWGDLPYKVGANIVTYALTH